MPVQCSDFRSSSSLLGSHQYNTGAQQSSYHGGHIEVPLTEFSPHHISHVTLSTPQSPHHSVQTCEGAQLQAVRHLHPSPLETGNSYSATSAPEAVTPRLGSPTGSYSCYRRGGSMKSLRCHSGYICDVMIRDCGASKLHVFSGDNADSFRRDVWATRQDSAMHGLNVRCDHDGQN